MTYYAHTLTGPNDQSLTEAEWEHLFTGITDDPGHLEKVALLASNFAAAFDAANWGRLAGLWHDLGKYLQAFQNRLRGENISVEHAGAGAALAAKLLGPQVGLPLAFAIAGHHAGLANLRSRQSEDHLTPLEKRLRDAETALTACLQVAPGCLSSLPDLTLPESITSAEGQPEATVRKFALFTRLLFSALVDADSLATEAFQDARALKTRLRAQPIYDSIDTLHQRMRHHLDGLAANADDTDLNRHRTRIGDWARAAASQPPGVFTLNVPTGGGKTYAGMAFALEHIVRHQATTPLRRVVVAVPFTTIIEQNADDYANLLGAHNVIQHHSNLDEQPENDREDERLLRRRLACENWDAPVIVTTNVQLFESLFAHKKSRARKLHNLAGSVIILDEAQCIPTGFIGPILETLRFLVSCYHCTVVLCTATHPAWELRDKFRQGFGSLTPIIPPAERLWEEPAFDRVRVHWPATTAPTSYPELAQSLSAHACALAIVHRRTDARQLAQLIQTSRPGDRLFHLSTHLCPAHRRQVITAIKAALETHRRDGTPVRAVATQLVECGINFDWPVLYRAMAGLDSLAQAAGRCNREGHRWNGPGHVHIFHAETEPPDTFLARAKAVATSLLNKRGGTLDLRDPATFSDYFKSLHAEANLDEKNILGELSQLNFETAGRLMQLINSPFDHPVIIPFDDEAVGRIAEVQRLASAGVEHLDRFALRRLQPYTVQLSRHQAAQIQNALDPLYSDATAQVLNRPLYPKLYDTVFGLCLEDDPRPDPSRLIA